MSNEIERPIGQTNADVQKRRRSIPWLWEGVLVTGGVTLLSAPEKVGKTTLLSLLLDRRRAGGELLGRTVWPGKTILCSEESKDLWALRQPPLDFGPDLVYHQPRGPVPMRGRWSRFVNDLHELCFPDGPYDLVVIDTAVSFLPLVDRNKRTLRWALATLHDIASFPVAVLVLNQSRNVHRPLAASSDIVIDMTMPRGPATTRRRTFTGVGRYPDTLQAASAELNPDGTDYVLLPDSPVPKPPLLGTLQALLTASPTPLTCHELLDRWPGSSPRPDSLWRTLARGIELGVFTGAGKGTKTEPFRFTMSRAEGEEPAAPPVAPAETRRHA
jgi:hypothetical protein